MAVAVAKATERIHVTAEARSILRGKRKPPEGSQPDMLPFLPNDFGNARRLIAMSGQDLRFCHSLRKWLLWDGRRWKPDVTGEAYWLAGAAMLAFVDQSLDAGDKENLRFAVGSLNERRIVHLGY